MGAFEKDQAYMQKLMQECLSDEDSGADPYESDATNDEYRPDSNAEDSDSSYEVRQTKKKIKIIGKAVSHPSLLESKPYFHNNRVEKYKSPSTLTELQPSTSISSSSDNSERNRRIDDSIENVIREMNNFDSEEEPDQTPITNVDNSDWGPVTGEHLKNIPFSEERHGFHAKLYEDLHDKGPYDFFKLFVNDEIINYIVSFVFHLFFILELFYSCFLQVIETNRYAEQVNNVYKRIRILRLV